MKQCTNRLAHIRSPIIAAYTENTSCMLRNSIDQFETEVVSLTRIKLMLRKAYITKEVAGLPLLQHLAVAIPFIIYSTRHTTYNIMVVLLHVAFSIQLSFIVHLNCSHLCDKRDSTR